ncbi:Fpg/Nei family DNA glycosylase [Opitutia bacterium ISCC 51]|nr:Fpg/Nei family DNA glycosylase [Opitutae bacterium ISCC 51]QXD28376.1 Fpg/Nei family DNA glycosylase [Opitutae bacterium ISCC 52]
MPELAEVDYFRKQWNPGLGQKVVQVITHPWTRLYRGESPLELVKGLAGASFVSSETHGKQMLFRTDNHGWLGIHLGMTGELLFTHETPIDDRYAHLVLQTEEGALVFNDPRQFGRVRFALGIDPPDWWADLPSQVLDHQFTFAYFSALLERRKGSQLKPLLLMQDLFPGIGNWMADEILWRARLAPNRRVKSLNESERRILFKGVRYVAKHSLRILGDDWGDFPDSWLFNHRWKAGGTCPKSKQPLSRDTIGGRTTCWSPALQL